MNAEEEEEEVESEGVNLKVLESSPARGLGVVSLAKTLYSTFPYWFDPVSV